MTTGTTFLAGAAAGACVDIALFPLDTVKTRLQSVNGFFAAGGFRGVYSGLSPVIAGSAPNAALFFCTYEGVKSVFSATQQKDTVPLHMLAASLAEVTACLVRVPVEVIKQRAQTSSTHSPLRILRSTLAAEGARGLYRGYISTVSREIPFSIVQFPLWEFLKRRWSLAQRCEVMPWQSSVCGAVAGGVAAFVTTPLDVAKTRIMLAQRDSVLARGNITDAVKQVLRERGPRGLFAGSVPRVLAISIGGAIFLGVYDSIKYSLNKLV